MSVIIPAYNERARLPVMLADAVEHLHSVYGAIPPTPVPGRGWEIILVSDGSTDTTTSVALSFAATHPHVAPDQVRVVELVRNRGKGGAVAHGMRHIRGRYAVFADADGATKFGDLAGLAKELQAVEEDGYAVAVGSRAHMVDTDAVVKRSFVRNLLMHSFHFLLASLGVKGVKDTQCGFKLFTKKAVDAIFVDLRTEGWIFDIEVLLLAGYKNVPVVEVPVSWHEVEGSKVVLLKDSVRMAWDLGVVRAGYACGIYTVGSGGPRR